LKVNRVPYNIIPHKWAFDPEIGPFIRDLLDMLFQLRERSGGDDDQVANVSTRSAFSWSKGGNSTERPVFHVERNNTMDWL